MGYPWFPESEDYEKQYVRDRRGTIWLICRDGGMVTTSDYATTRYTGGIAWLESTHGPLEYL